MNQCGFKNDNADSGQNGLEKYKQRVRTFIEGLKEQEYVSIGEASSKYMSDEMLFENLQKNSLPPARFIISDYEMPGMKGPEMCSAIRAHFDALSTKLVSNEDSDPEFKEL